MPSYTPPQQDLEFLLFDLFEVDKQWQKLPALADFTPDLVSAVIAEGGKLARDVMAPINRTGDEEGVTWSEAGVTTPKGFKDAFTAFGEGGWIGLAGNPEFGGQGMPKMMSCAMEEMFWAANPSLYLYATLTTGASICIDSHGTQEQKATYLPKLYSGEWTGVMALTEGHAGTDLGIMRTKAEPQANGSYRITGTKIFITGGDNDLAENIVHLVLAKLPDAPAGSRGISLFIVPKFKLDADGNPGEANGVTCGSVEHKMGIHGSATCVMNYDGAEGYLVGEENRGLAGMFTMMNFERLSVGIQGLGANVFSYQNSVAYAQDRLQGRSPSGPKNESGPADAIVEHPDVRRMLLTQRVFAEGGRAFALFVGMQLDKAKHGGDAGADRLSQLLTPIAKAFLTDRGFECSVLGQQVFGGHGFVREWGMEQMVRDTRIAQLYEGTNGVQAMDFIGRKVLQDGGSTLTGLIEQMSASDVADQHSDALAGALSLLSRVTDDLVKRAGVDADLPGAVAVDYLDLAGYVIYGWLWARMAKVGDDDKARLAEFYFARILPRIHGLEQSIAADASAVMNVSFSA
ncbi:MAG: acyl-CoA dehydrogenase C-terminal domain-containing protein [Pseudomonadaceae bacterium]|nr:acyl-CoA dehydrogenase C-terminal domain-containing protein [Pseudomonadaceae bacterium]